LADLTLASHRQLPMRKANRESAAGALGLGLPDFWLTWSMGSDSAAPHHSSFQNAHNIRVLPNENAHQLQATA
jgi:hypothetical protein